MTSNRLESAVRKLAAARTERDQLRLVRKWLTACEREYDKDTVKGQGNPCWKWLRDKGYSEGNPLVGYYHEEPPSAWAAGGESEEDWCTPCRLRQPVHLAYRAAVMAYGRASTAFWLTVRAMQSGGAL